MAKRKLGGRSREVLDVIYRRGEVSASDIHDEIPDLPSYSAVRSILRALEDKGLVEHREEGLRYVYSPTVPKGEASRTALQRVLDTFFGGQPEYALKAMLELSRDGGYDIDYDDLERLIDEAREDGR